MIQKIDLDLLAKEIRKMSVRSDLYKVLKRELLLRGWWKNLPRGKADPKRFK
jgi:hypothetical protein